MNSKRHLVIIRILSPYAALLLLPGVRAATLSWTNVAGGNWNSAANWSSGTVPVATDDVFITAAGTYTVTQNVSVTVASLTLGGANGEQTLMNTALGTLTLNNPSVVNAGAVFALNGPLAGAGPLTILGTVRWNGGRVYKTVVVSPSGTLILASGGNMRLSAALTNQGAMLWPGGGDFQLDTNVNNLAGAVFDVQNDARLLGFGGFAILNNAGVFRKSAGPGTTALQNARLLNSGTVDVQTGTVTYTTTGTRFDDGSRLTGAGTNLLDGGTITLNGAIYSENLVLAGATITGTNTLSGTVRWMGGWMDTNAVTTIATNGTLWMGGVQKRLYGTLNNQGLVTFTGAYPLLMQGTFCNEAGALFDLQSDANISRLAGSPAFTNAGTFRKSGGVALTQVGGVAFHNSGTVDVQTGIVQFESGYTQAGGTMRFGVGSLTNFGSVNIWGDAPLTGTTLAVNFNNGYIPPTGSTFAFLSYESVSGSFSDLDVANEVAWRTDNSIYGPLGMTLTVLNVRPTLAPIPDRTTDEEEPLSVTTVGNDLDVDQSLTYSLVNPPAETTINASSGRFT